MTKFGDSARFWDIEVETKPTHEPVVEEVVAWVNIQVPGVSVYLGVSQLDLATSKSPEWHMCEACKGSWRVTPAVALQDKTSSLARQLAYESNSWLIPVTRPSCQNALFVRNLTFHIPYTPYYKYLYSHEM